MSVVPSFDRKQKIFVALLIGGEYLSNIPLLVIIHLV
jgi:hypothetical protein